ncbi:rhomboid family intramembrane serine protease, partial [Myxococcota bacterium]|nr:rhomboid family intramembrane serine protease [Myxococcota bacterium]
MDENTPEEPEVPPLEIEVRRPALMSRIVVFLVVFAAAFGATSLFELASRAMRGLPFERLIEPLATAVFWFVIGGVTLSWRLYVRSRPLNPIKFNPDHVMMPRAADALGYLKVAYDDILALRLVERGNGVLIALIETRSHVFLFPRDVFVIDNGPQTLLGALHLKIRDRPEGLSVLARMERRRSLAHKISARRPIATQALLGVLAVFTVNQLITGEGLSDSPYELAAWGGTVYPLVLSGEIWRLLSAAFLHQGLGHAIFAGLAVFYAGSMVERILGWERAILIFLVSAFASQLGELILQPVMPVVGASGGALGLLGALGHLNWRFHTQLPLGFRQPKRWWVTVAISVALLSMVWPWVSFFGHLAGALAGFGVSWLLVGRHRGEIAG